MAPEREQTKASPSGTASPAPGLAPEQGQAKAAAAPPARAPGLAWDRRAAAFGAACALPAVALAPVNLTLALGLAVGSIPAALVGVPPRRRGRVAILMLGVVTGVPMFVGGLLAGEPVLAVAAIALLGPATAIVAARSRLGMVAMTLSLPLVGVGLSYAELGTAAAAAGLIVVGSAFACALSMLWPERPPGPRRGAAPTPTIDYGVRLGLAGATAAAIGFLLDLDHVGWATAAALLVMRPAAEMQRLRSVGRVLAVFVGAFAAVALVDLGPPDVVYGAAAALAVAAAAGTHGSRWYVTAAFTTFILFLLLLHGHPEDAAWRFGERLGETALGVAIAYLFGLALPALRRR